MTEQCAFLDQLTAVERTAARSVLQEIIRLADQAPVLTEEQLRFRLLALAQCALPRSEVVRTMMMPGLLERRWPWMIREPTLVGPVRVVSSGPRAA